MSDLERTGGEKNEPERDARDQRSDMSTRSERRRQQRGQGDSPKRMSGGTIAAIVLVIAMIGIVAYAIIQRNAQVSGAAVSPNALPSIPPPLKVGTKAPGFSLTTKIGVLSQDSFAGHPYLLEIFATWCPHCQRMTSVLRDIRKRFPLDKLGMVSATGSPIGMASTPDNEVPETQADVDAFDEQFNVTWPAAFDQNLTVAKTWGFAGFPGIYIVDAKGTIRYVHSGEIDEKTLIAEIQKAGG